MAFSPRGKSLGYRDVPGLLAAKTLPRVLVLLGDEQELKDETTRELERILTSRYGSAPERYRLDCEDVQLGQVSATHLVGSLFSTPKLVVLQRFEKAPIAARKAFLNEVGSGNFHETITVVIHATDRALPAGVEGPHLTAVMFWPLNQAPEVQAWIQNLFKRMGRTPAPDLVPHIYRRYGSHLSAIRGEVEKACLYSLTPKGEKPTVTVAHFDAMAVAAPTEELFPVLSALVARRTKEAIAGLKGLWAQGEAPQKVIPLLLFQYQRLMYVSALYEADPGRFRGCLPLLEEHRKTTAFFRQKSIEKDLAARFADAIKGSPFEDYLGELRPMAVLECLSQATRSSAAEVHATYRELMRLDFRMKTSSIDPELAVEMLAAR